MPNPFPYFRWFPSDASGDEAYTSMTDQERGFFHRCLNHAWMNDGLPGDPDMLAAVMRVTRKYLDRVWPHVVQCGGWELTDTVHPRWINHRQEDERDHARGKSIRAGKVSPYVQVGIPGFLYLMRRTDGAIKIGTSVNVPRRLAQLRYKYNDIIQLVGKVRVESMGEAEMDAHNKYASKRLTGEWFQLTEADAVEILGESEVITPKGDSGGDNKGDSVCHPTPRAYDSVSGSVVDFEVKKKLPTVSAKTSQRFEEFWALWPRKVGRDAAFMAWSSVVTVENEENAFACLHRFLASGDCARGAVPMAGQSFNKPGWIFDCARDEWESDWPRAPSVVTRVSKQQESINRIDRL